VAPHNAESTQVVELAKRFAPSDIFPRSVLVTALNLDVGRWIWWPSSLSRKRDVDLDQFLEETAAVPR
jgi:hypothetical protein